MAGDLRKYARQTNVRLGLGAIFLLFGVGIPLIYLFYGKNAAVTGLLCLAAAMLPVFLVWVVLWVIGLLVKRANGDDE